MVQDGAIHTMEQFSKGCEFGTIPESYIIGRTVPSTQISKLRRDLTLNMSVTVQDRHIQWKTNLNSYAIYRVT